MSYLANGGGVVYSSHVINGIIVVYSVPLVHGQDTDRIDTATYMGDISQSANLRRKIVIV